VTIQTERRSADRGTAPGRGVPGGRGTAAPAVELTWVGNGAWRATDTTVPADDARCLIAYVECVHHRVEVTWLDSRRPRSFFPSLREAYAALNRYAE